MKSVVHKSTRREGGQLRNGNAKKGIVLPDNVKLDTVEGILTFMRTVLIPSTLSGEIGTRQSSAIATACKILLDYDADLRALEEIKTRLDRMEEEQNELDAILHRAATKQTSAS